MFPVLKGDSGDTYIILGHMSYPINPREFSIDRIATDRTEQELFLHSKIIEAKEDKAKAEECRAKAVDTISEFRAYLNHLKGKP